MVVSDTYSICIIMGIFKQAGFVYNQYIDLDYAARLNPIQLVRNASTSGHHCLLVKLLLLKSLRFSVEAKLSL